jgi:hypothetical protein
VKKHPVATTALGLAATGGTVLAVSEDARKATTKAATGAIANARSLTHV